MPIRNLRTSPRRPSEASSCRLGALSALLGPELEDGAGDPFALDRSSTGFTEYRPLIADHVQARAFLAERAAGGRADRD